MPELKTCSSCKNELPTSEFNKKRNSLQTFCKKCAAANSRAYYAANRESHKKATSERKKKNIIHVQQYVYDYLKNNGCISCSENDPSALDFDHVRGIKTRNVSKMIAFGNSLATVLKEIAKCDIRCANCHRKKTAKDQRWYCNINTGL